MGDRESPRRFSRKWFGEIFFGCWGALVLVKVALGAPSLDRHGVLYWLVVLPLWAGFVGTGVPWLLLGARDVLAHQTPAWNQARPWLLGLIAVAAVVFSVLALRSV